MMDNRFSALGRAELLGRMTEETFDVLVIGGGITGAGIALDAASRGMRTALIEMQDFAAGTSSRSTKLIHGGLRYLKQLEVRMVAEVGRERAVVYENGPHVTTPERMLLPFYQGGTFGALTTSLGLLVYDWLAGVRKAERRVMLSREETAAKEPLLKRDGLLGGGSYVEYRTDDARLTIEVLKKAVDHGAAAVNYVQAESLMYDDGIVCGALALDRLGSQQLAIRARTVVNAAGPWADEMRELDGSKSGKRLRLTKGVHLVFDGERFPLRQAVYFDTPDGRMLFAIPREGKTYVGTTDTDYVGDKAHPRMTADDRTYVLAAANGMFPGLALTEADVESSWAGLRPLIFQEGKSPSEVSRRDEIFRSPSGLLTIAGGKLTGYRKMAETIVDRLAKEPALRERGPFGPCATRTMPIAGGDVGGSAGFPAFVARMKDEAAAQGVRADVAEAIARRYGSNAREIFAYMRADSGDAAAYGLAPEVYAMLRYAIEREMAATPADFLVRRTGALFFDRAAAAAWKEGVVRAMADRLGWTDAQRAQHAEQIDAELERAVTAAEA